jgi:hypothetical protein
MLPVTHERLSSAFGIVIQTALGIASLAASSGCTVVNSNSASDSGTNSTTGTDASADGGDDGSASPSPDANTGGGDGGAAGQPGVPDAAQEGEAGSSLSMGLVAYYPFDGDALDHSGNSNNCTVMGATLTSDRFGQANSAYAFAGSATWIVAMIRPSVSRATSPSQHGSTPIPRL